MSEVVERASPQLVDDLQMVRLGDYLNVIRGASPRPKGDPCYFGGDIPWISISDITREPGKYLSRTREFVTRAGAEKSRLLPAGTLILSNSGTVCVPKILRVDGCIHDGFVAFPDLPDSFDKNYLYWFFEYVRPSIIEANRQGITQVNLNTGIVREIRLPLTSIERQREIVAELEKQFSRLDEAVANLQRVKANLKRYKASVLKAAVEGRLVETEATLARREGRTYETGEQLLQRVLLARPDQWSARGRYVEPLPAETKDLSPLPDGWKWASIDQLSDFITKGTTPAATKLFDGSGEVQFLKVYNLTFDGSLNHTYKAAYVSRATHKDELARSQVFPGDVLINIVGPPLGQVSVVPAHVEVANINQAIARIRPVKPIGSEFIAITLMCDDIMRWAIRRGKTTAGQANLTLELCRALPIPVPPLAEQVRIVAEVDRHLSIIREVEAEVDANLQRAQALRQATLRSCFQSKGS